VKVTIYKGKSIVMTATIDDDGNTRDDKKPGGPQSIELNNPGPGLPEPGVYKIVVDGTRDSVMTGISTNLHKIAFEGPLYPVTNKEVYGSIAGSTAPTTVFANADNVTVTANHTAALQNVRFGSQNAALTTVNQPVSLGNQSNSQITAPKSDVVINGAGYFAFTQEQLFAPTRYKLLQVQTAEDMQNIDYLITDYRSPRSVGGGWQIADRTFTLNDAVSEKDKLSWVITAPGIKENGRSIQVKDLQMIMSKGGWVK
jgi:hypothetical protein